MTIRDVHRLTDDETSQFRERALVARRWAERAVEAEIVDFYRGLAASYDQIADGNAGIPHINAVQDALRASSE